MIMRIASTTTTHSTSSPDDTAKKASPTRLQVTSMQSNVSRSINAPKLEFVVIIYNNAPQSLPLPHHSGADDTDTFPGGELHVLPNTFRSAGVAIVPRIPPQTSVTVRIATCSNPGFKLVEELDVEAKFELYTFANGKRTLVPCCGTFPTDNAVWHKSVVEFAGDVVHARPATWKRSNINVLFYGAAAGAWTSTLLNSLITMMSFVKQPISPAPVGTTKKRKQHPSSTPLSSSSSTSSSSSSLWTSSTVDTPVYLTSYTPPGHGGECVVRLLDIASGQRALSARSLENVVKGNYIDTNKDNPSSSEDNNDDDDDDDADDLLDDDESAADRRCDVIVLVVPAPMLLDSTKSAALAQTFELVNRASSNAQVAVTQLDRVPPHNEAKVSAAAQRIFGISGNRVFLTPVYQVGDLKRTATVERPLLALMHAAIRQAITNQTRPA